MVSSIREFAWGNSNKTDSVRIT